MLFEFGKGGQLLKIHLLRSHMLDTYKKYQLLNSCLTEKISCTCSPFPFRAVDKIFVTVKYKFKRKKPNLSERQKSNLKGKLLMFWFYLWRQKRSERRKSNLSGFQVLTKWFLVFNYLWLKYIWRFGINKLILKNLSNLS